MIKLAAKVLSISFLGAAFLAGAINSASAVPIACGNYTTDDAVVNNNGTWQTAADCGVKINPAGGSGGEASFMGTEFGGTWSYLGKIQSPNSPQEVASGWSFAAYSPAYSNYDFGFQLIAPVADQGKIVDFALGVKQGTVLNAYYFPNVVLGIIGSYNSRSFGNPEDPAFSHISAFITTPQNPPCDPSKDPNCKPFIPVPEPGALSLFGLGLLGLGLNRRRIRIEK